MEQLFHKALSLPKTEYIKLAKAMMPYTQTSFSLTEIMGLAWDVMLKSPTFSQSRVPLTDYQMPGKNIKGVGDCVYYDLDYAKDILHAYFYQQITPEDYIAQNGVRKNDWYAEIMGEVPSNPSTPSQPSDPTVPDDSTSDGETDTTPDDTTSQPDGSQGDATTPPDKEEETQE